MEFKEAIKIRRRICDYYKDCDGCPLCELSPNCVCGLLKVENTDGYEKILEKWVKEHQRNRGNAFEELYKVVMTQMLKFELFGD